MSFAFLIFDGVVRGGEMEETDCVQTEVEQLWRDGGK